ncbi:threonine/serine exporter family protein [Companilactobacillus mishanensis]|uniref:Threonine/serine exporter n=1 Tax=Companilactobacillus mishanensis TaxID=2486008 RepID=A0A5P0ZJE3_9LACO|nr:threonine/serine exporter family protein [Companilactobacillus mishanensis]MQS45005.1 threonine/serine exporter [Companilactobacillus mishanensis]MQS53194.1 threonine/serine exporter [Companilactobacillus mishanensis]MQS90325.1 threonine/serine exporter [Companilactobacillus mishanensis]
MDILINFILGSLSAIGFSIITNAPRRAAGIIGLTGGLSWTTFYILKNYSHMHLLIANFCGAVVISALAYYFSRKFHLPENIISIPCLVNLVPGGNAYRTMLYMVQGKYIASLNQGIQTFLIASFLAIGLFATPYMLTLIKQGISLRKRKIRS